MVGKEGKYMFGFVKVSEKGQIVIPKEAREVFGIKSGDQLLLLGDVSTGLALVHTDALNVFDDIMGNAFSKQGKSDENEQKE